MRKSLLILVVSFFCGCDQTRQPTPTIEPATESHPEPAPILQNSVTESPVDVVAEVAKVRRADEEREEKLQAEYFARVEAVKTEADQESLDRWRGSAGIEKEAADRAAIRTLMPLLRRAAAEPAAVPGLIFAAVTGDSSDREQAAGWLRRYHLARPEVLSLAEGPWGLAGED